MKRYRLLHHLALAFALASLPLAGILLWAQQQRPPVRIPITPPEQGYPKLWKSETTGKEYRVQVDRGRFYAEWVNIPPESAKRGAYIRSECRRVGQNGLVLRVLICRAPWAEGRRSTSPTPATCNCELKLTPFRRTGSWGAGKR